jgi:aldehyde:ferredoxin oxidoreductase
LDAIGITGYDDEKLNELGKKIYKTKLEIKEKLGFRLSDVYIPKRVFETPAMGEIIDENTVREMIQMFDVKNKALFVNN